MRLAAEFEGEIISVDSMQVYRGMDIGTAKPTADERRAVPHHLIDLVDVTEDFSVSQFQEVGRSALHDVLQRGRTPIIAGGTGLHFRSLVDPLDFPPTDAAVRAEIEAQEPDARQERLLEVDPKAGDHVDLGNPRRVVRALEVLQLTGLTPTERSASPEAVAVREYRPVSPFVGIGVDPGEELRGRVVERFDRMLQMGLMEEVRALEPRMGRVARQAVGYKELIDVVHARLTMDAGRSAAIAATAALAKRQRTFFRRDPRISWLEQRSPDQMFAAACAIIARHDEG